MRIAEYITTKGKPFIIAELSGNHNQSLERALRLIDLAVQSGVSAVKLQTYTADTMTLDIAEGEFFINDPEDPWHGQSLYQLYQKAYTPWSWHEQIFKHCADLGIIAFSTAFDISSVDFLESLNCPIYKIAAFENIDIPLIKKVATTRKPMIISTGMATIAELDEAVHAAQDNGCPEVTLLKCTSAYPASPQSANLRTIPHMQELFKCNVGISDHTMGIGVAIAAVALGATVIEKHFTDDRALGGVDSAFSMEPQEMRELTEEVGKVWQALGNVYYGATREEKTSVTDRRSLYVVQDIKKGEALTKDNIRSIRPGNGLPPKYYDILLGKRVNRELVRGTALTWDMIG